MLVLLVLCSLILLTAYFGASPSSPLHSVQQGIAEVMSPIEDGASKVLSPVRDVFGWFSDTIHAKTANKQLEHDRQVLTLQVDQDQYAIAQNVELKRELHLVDSTTVSQYGLVDAEVIGVDPIVWYQTITVGVGSDSGVRLYDPVIGNGGLVGDVTAVGSNEATVSEYSSPNFAVGAMVLGSGQPPSGVLQPAVGNPTNLQLNYLPQNTVVNPGEDVTTSGFRDTGDPQIASCYPAAIPIGTVASASYDSQTNSEQVDVTPEVDLRLLSGVQILTTNLPSGC